MGLIGVVLLVPNNDKFNEFFNFKKEVNINIKYITKLLLFSIASLLVIILGFAIAIRIARLIC